MNKFIWALLSTMLLLSCATEPQKKDVIGQINEDITASPSAAGGVGTNYYVCDDGDDANDGLSEEAPWKSFDKAIEKFNKLDAGDAVLLCRGGEFTSTYQKYLYNAKCLAENPCIFSDYYSYNTQVEDKRPHITSAHARNVFNFQDGGAPDHDEGYLVENLILSGTKKGVGNAFFFYNDVDDVVLNNITIDSFQIAVQIAGSNNERFLLSQVEASNVDYWLMGAADGVVSKIETEVTNTPVEKLPLVETVISNTKTGIDHYFVCDDGDDNNSGLSPITPFRTFSKGMSKFRGLLAGGSISFCRGGEFVAEKTSYIFNQNCMAEKSCNIQDYSSSTKQGAKLPIIYGESIFGLTDGGAADPDGGYKIRNLTLRATVPGEGIGFLLYNDVDDVIIDNVTVDGFRLGFNLAQGGTLNEGANAFNERIVIKNSRIINNAGQGLFGACNDCLITNNLFSNNGYARKVFNHNIYIGGTVENMTISNNILRKSAIIDGKCTGVSLVVHGTANNLTIENNLIEEELGVASHGCWGITVNPGYVKEESFTNLIIRNNDVLNMGNMSIGCASCVNVLIEGNRVSTVSDLGGFLISVPAGGDDTVVSENITIKDNIMISSNIATKVIAIKTNLLNDKASLENNRLYVSENESVCQYTNGEQVDNEQECELVH